MRKAIAVMIILLLHTVMLLAAELPTVEEILNKVARQTQAQQDNLRDLQCRQIVTLESPSGNSVTTASDLYIKGKKVKTVIYDEDKTTVLQTQIINEEYFTIIDYAGHLIKERIDTMLTAEQKQQVSEALDSVSLPGSLNYTKDPAQFLNDYQVSIDMQQSDSSKAIYVLSVKNPIDTVTQKEKPNNFFKKMEITIDHEQGLALSAKYYNESNLVNLENRFEDYEHVGTGAESFWYAKQTVEKTRLSNNDYMNKTVRQENIRYNQGLADSIFEP